MEENNSNQQPEQNESVIQNKPMNGMTIVGINLAVLAVYTLLLKLTAADGGFILDAFLLVLHVLTCIIMSIIKKSGSWLLSAFLVLAIGFSTCVYILPMNLK